MTKVLTRSLELSGAVQWIRHVEGAPRKPAIERESTP